MVYLTVINSDGEWSHRTEPVLALQSEVRDTYSIPRSEFGIAILPPTHEERLDAGWQFGGQEMACGALVLDGDYGLISTSHELMENCSNAASGLVALPWPENEERDKKQIEAHVPSLQAVVVRQMARDEERLAKFKAAAEVKK